MKTPFCSTRRKAQVWISDYTISTLLFIIAIVLVVKIMTGGFATTEKFDELRTDAVKISEALLSEGVPEDWTNDTVIRPGLLTGWRLNQTKVVRVMEMGNFSYAQLKGKLQTRNEFMVAFWHDEIISFSGHCKIGGPDVTVAWNATSCTLNLSSADYDDLVRMRRYVVHEGKIAKMEVMVWH